MSRVAPPSPLFYRQIPASRTLVASRTAPLFAARALRLVQAAPDPALLVEQVVRAQRGDESALRALYDAHVQHVAGLALRLLRNRADAEEIVQDTFVAAFTKLSDLREPERLRSWLTAIAVRRIQKKRRKERVLALLGFTATNAIPLEALAAAASPEEARSQLRALDVALSRLPERHQLAWMLRHVEDEPLDSIAEACECSLATVKRWLDAADERLARTLEPDGVPPSSRRVRT